MAIKGNDYTFSAPSFTQQLQSPVCCWSTKTHLSSWIVILITLTAVVRLPIKAAKRFELTKKTFPHLFSEFPFLLICRTFNLRLRIQVLNNSCKNNMKNGEGCHRPESATMHNVLWSSGYSSRCVRFGDLQTLKSYAREKNISDSDRDKSTACNKSSNKRWE